MLEQLVVLKDVSIEYRHKGTSVVAVDRLSLDVPKGQFLSVVGPSGCGKSTLLKAIAGLVPGSPSSEILVEGRGVGMHSPPDGLAMMFQSPVLLDWLTVIDNVGLPLEARKVPRAQARAEAKELLSYAGVANFANSHPYQLSGGMQQRVALCRALIGKPRLLLMDEPFGALDAMTRDAMALFLQQLWIDHQVTVVFVTHSIPEAVFLSDRVVVFSQRPASVVEAYDIDLPRPRSLDDRATPEFQRYVAAITRLFEKMGLLGGH